MSFHGHEWTHIIAEPIEHSANSIKISRIQNQPANLESFAGLKARCVGDTSGAQRT